MPGFIKPQLATLKSEAPSRDQWLREIKHDGYRVQIHVDAGKKRVFTRNVWTGRKGSPSLPAPWVSPGHAIIDGEWWLSKKDGRSFQN
jgi:bifunctional non-homologous end joining protein LigD